MMSGQRKGPGSELGPHLGIVPRTVPRVVLETVPGIVPGIGAIVVTAAIGAGELFVLGFLS